MKQFTLSASVLALVMAAGSAMAAQQPDAGRTVQELKKAPALPAASSVPVIETPVKAVHAAGGKVVKVERVVLRGNTSVGTPELLEALGNVYGKSLDLAGMKTLADKVSDYYHAHDYPFAKAFVPAQGMKGGTLEIVVVEGRYGAVKVDGGDSRAAAAQKFLSQLQPGEVIEGKQLERASLLLDDQPGYSFTPTIRPGSAAGTGDLTVLMKPEKKYGGSVSADNHGNRYTGTKRGLVDLYADSPFTFGDKVALSGIYTTEDMWYGSANYSRPIGSSGLRGNAGFSQTYYELGKDFKALDAHGTAQIATMGLSYPIVRSQEANLTLSANYQHKWLKDEQGTAGTDNNKASDVIPLSLNFDKRDGLIGGGVTYGAVTWTHGALYLDSGLRATDRTTAHSEGIFNKVNVDVARVQATPVKKLTMFGRVSGQIAGNNLDSSEDFGLGGPDGVRAYPSGEGFGDEGWMAQIEARYAVNDAVTPYAFYDYGSVKTNHNKWNPGTSTRDIGGGGVGVRASYKNFTADASAAWRANGGAPQSDSKENTPQMWVKVGYTF